ncbi:MAG: hypothetical protein LUF30_08845, partial [Lachnospiraceae bacterium]|nr:hypothetical protein [Lachnospiraceae bacterium]
MKRKKILASMLAAVMLVLTPASAAMGVGSDTVLTVDASELTNEEESQENLTADEDTADALTVMLEDFTEEPANEAGSTR